MTLILHYYEYYVYMYIIIMYTDMTYIMYVA